MIKIINKERYEELIAYSKRLERQVEFYKEEIKKDGIIIKEKDTKINDEITSKELIRKENTALKSKITRLQNKIKKMEEEQNNDKKLVKETIKEVHKEHKKKMGRPRKENK